MLTPNFSDSQRPAFSNPDEPSRNTPSRIFTRNENEEETDADARDNSLRRGEQVPVDLIDEESMESFPCSDPPSYSRCHV